MVSKVTIELDDKSGPAFAKYLANVNKSDTETDELAGSISNLEGELEEARSQIESMALDLKEAADAQARLNSQQRQGGGESANYAEKITAISTGTLAVVEVIKKGIEAGKKFVQAIRSLAEQGNPAAAELAASFDQVTKSFQAMAEDPRVQEAFRSLAGILKDDIAPVIEKLPSYWSRTQDAIAGAITASTDYLGITEGASEQLDQMLVQQEKHLEQIKKETEEEKAILREKKVQAEIDKIDAQTARAASVERLSKITDAKTLEEMRAKEIDDLKKLAKEDKLSDEDRTRRLEGIADITARTLSAEKDRIELQKKAAEEQKKFFDALKGQWETVAKSGSAVYQKATAAAQVEVDKMIAKQKAEVKAIADALNKQQGGDGKEKDVVARIKGTITGEDIAKKVAEQRSEKEIADFRKKNRDLVANAESGVDEFSSRRLRHEEDRIRNRARNRALGQAQAGGAGISEEEIANAEQALTQSVIDQAASAGKLTINQADGLRAAARAAQETAKIQAQQAQDIEAIINALDEVTQGTKSLGQRTRAQRGSSGG